MMNVVVLVGRLTRDPELRRANSGTSVCSFTIAVDRSFKQPGQPEADFPYVTAFGKTAENLCQYQRKGSLIGVTGRLQTRSYDDQNGQRQYRTEVIADRIDWLESRRAVEAHQQGGYGGYQDNGGYGNSYNQGGYGNSYGGGYNAPQQNSYNNGGYNNQGYNNSYAGGSGYSSYGNSYGGYNAQQAPNSYSNAANSQPKAGNDYPAAKADYTNKAAAAADDMDHPELDKAFDDDDDLDISRDDLPF